MSKRFIRHSCGHNIEHNIGGKYKHRGAKAEWLASQDCFDCYKLKQSKKREQKNIEAKKANKDLVELKGSPKQIAWAESIRREKISTDMFSLTFIRRKAESADAVDIVKLIDRIINNTSAEFWINNRSKDAEDIIRSERS